MTTPSRSTLRVPTPPGVPTRIATPASSASDAAARNDGTGDRYAICAALHDKAIALRQIGLLDQADDFERQAVDRAADFGCEQIVAVARVGRAEICLLRGDAHAAERLALDVAYTLYDQRASDCVLRANALRVAGTARVAIGDLAGARTVLEEALRLAREQHDAVTEAEVLRALAELCVWEGDRRGASTAGRASIMIFQGLGAAGPLAHDDCARLERWVTAIERDLPPS